MEIPNAFIGQPAQPTDAEIAAALGPTAETWKQLLDWLAAQGASIQEWKSSSPKYGWSLLLKLKKRTIVYLAPCDGCFRVSFVLGDRAVAAARQSDLPKPVLKLLDETDFKHAGQIDFVDNAIDPKWKDQVMADLPDIPYRGSYALPSLNYGPKFADMVKRIQAVS